MPFVYDETQVEWPDEDTEPPRPRADQFVYIAPSEFGGGRAPVRFDVPPLQSPLQASAPELPSQSRPQGWNAEDRERAKREWEQRWERIRSIVIPALQQIGGRRIYCRYDGGNDEGFAWFDSLELQDGQRIDLDAAAQRLHDAQIHTRLRSVGVELQDPFSPRAGGSLLERGALKYFVEMLCHDWATVLLGRSFGTGEYSMYGAFTVDLETRTITDDQGADAVVQNISIDQ